MKQVGPKLVVNARAQEHSAESIANGSMRMLNRSILMRGVHSNV
jgi:hypothetical protein